MLKKLVPALLVVILVTMALPLAVFAQSGQPPAGVPGGFYGGRRGGRGGMMGRMGGWMGGGMTLVDAIAEVTGMSVEDVVAALQEGQTFEDLVAGADATLEDVVDVVVSAREAALAEAVAAGRITQEHADYMLEEMSEHLLEQLENGWAARGYGFNNEEGGTRGRGGFRGFGGSLGTRLRNPDLCPFAQPDL